MRTAADDELLWALYRDGQRCGGPLPGSTRLRQLRGGTRSGSQPWRIRSGVDEALEQVRRFDLARRREGGSSRVPRRSSPREVSSRRRRSSSAARPSGGTRRQSGSGWFGLQRLRDCPVRRPAADDPRSVVRAALDPDSPSVLRRAAFDLSRRVRPRPPPRAALRTPGALRIRHRSGRRRRRHALVLHRGRGHEDRQRTPGRFEGRAPGRAHPRAGVVVREGGALRLKDVRRRVSTPTCPRTPSSRSGPRRLGASVVRRPSGCCARLDARAEGHAPSAARSLRRALGGARRGLESAPAARGDSPASKRRDPDLRGVARLGPARRAARTVRGRPRRPGKGPSRSRSAPDGRGVLSRAERVLEEARSSELRSR